jgi:putrescine transport system ATP-binding protein
VQVAPPEEIYERPNSRWVADFIGDVNLIEGKIASLDTAGTLIEAAGTVRFRAGPNDGVKAGDAVVVAVRPEKIAIAPADGGQRADALIGEVVEIGYRGDASVYKVRLDSGLTLKATVANTTRRLAQPTGWNARVALSWPADAGMVLTQ